MSHPSEEYRFRLRGGCPCCGTIITIKANLPEDLMMVCEGCGKGLAFFNGQILVVRAKFLEALNKTFSTRNVGIVDHFDLSKRRGHIPEEKILKEALSVPGEDCMETLGRLLRL